MSSRIAPISKSKEAKKFLSLADIESADRKIRSEIHEAYVESLDGYIYYRSTTADKIAPIFDKDGASNEVRNMAQLVVECACQEDGTALYDSVESILASLMPESIVDIALAIVTARRDEREKKGKQKGNGSRR